MYLQSLRVSGTQLGVVACRGDQATYQAGFCLGHARAGRRAFPDAPLIQVVLDNLNTHTPASLYDAFPPEKARRMLHRLEFHSTPKHGSWLNMAEIELSVLGRQCLDQRLPSMQRVQAVIAHGPQARNTHQVQVE